jgi:hypothetical protein
MVRGFPRSLLVLGLTGLAASLACQRAAPTTQSEGDRTQSARALDVTTPHLEPDRSPIRLEDPSRQPSRAIPGDGPRSVEQVVELIREKGGLIEFDAGVPIAVDLNAADITDETMRQLTALTHVRRLDLGGTPITDKAIASIATMKELETLSLVGTDVTDEGIQSLRVLRELRLLYVSGSCVTDDGVGRLQAALPRLNVER